MYSAHELEGVGCGLTEVESGGSRETGRDGTCEAADRPAAENQDGQENDANCKMPWWAGAFRAVPEMRDSPEARGCYAMRFCELFFPDNTSGATEVSQGEMEIYSKICP